MVSSDHKDNIQYFEAIAITICRRHLNSTQLIARDYYEAAEKAERHSPINRRICIPELPKTSETTVAPVRGALPPLRCRPSSRHIIVSSMFALLHIHNGKLGA